MTTDDHDQVRRSIYSRYGTDFQDAPDVFEPEAAIRWAKAYRWYLRGWLPSSLDASIAELGCGSGRLLHFLSQRGYTNLQGVDISADQVARARHVVPEVAHANALDWLSGRKEQFDLIVALDLIEHLTRKEALSFLDLCANALNPGGRLVLQTPNADSPLGMQLRYGDLTHEWAYGVGLLTRLLRRAGFSLIQAREHGPIPWGYSIASTVRWLAWQGIRAGLQVWCSVESGAPLHVLSRALLVSAQKGAVGIAFSGRP
jgi:2-polyprenyl-3-methyl-5-hydroxy-6-metoxy-1,4-benzoquinol methylase